MFCPFTNGEYHKDCVFRHMPRQTTGSLQCNPNPCVLAIAADELDQYLLMKTEQEEIRTRSRYLEWAAQWR